MGTALGALLGTAFVGALAGPLADSGLAGLATIGVAAVLLPTIGAAARLVLFYEARAPTPQGAAVCGPRWSTAMPAMMRTVPAIAGRSSDSLKKTTPIAFTPAMPTPDHSA